MEFIRSSHLLLLLLLAKFVQGCTHSSSSIKPTENNQCPPWFFYNTSSKFCECYSSPSLDGIVQCTQKGALLQFGYCMTYEEVSEEYSVGRCYYFDLSKYNLSTRHNFITLPSNLSKLNEYMCEPLNRRRDMCSQCLDGYGPSMTSIMYSCEKCSDSYWLPLLGYFFLELGLITVFFFLILFLRLNLTLAPMMSFVLYSQYQGFLFAYITKRYVLDDRISLYWRFLMVFYGIFNLDFCRYIIPPFCASPNIKPFHITYLYYIPLIYLLCLMAVTWLCITKPITCIKRKLDWARLRHVNSLLNCNKNTMIDVFATFSFLSYARLMFISIDAGLRPVAIWKAKNDSTRSSKYLYTEPNIRYDYKEYLPLIVLSSVVTLVVPILPILLALYPIRAFRSLLFKFQVISKRMGAVTMFLDKFYSCFRDGLDGGRDMRSFVSIYYLMYWITFILTLIQEIYAPVHINFGAIIFTVFGFLVAILRPYKTTFMNASDSLILTNLALFYTLFDESMNYYYLSFFYWFVISALNTIPLIVLAATLSYRVSKRCKKSSISCCKILSKLKEASSHLLKHTSEEADIEKLMDVSVDSNNVPKVPDRMLHPECYDTESNSYGSTYHKQSLGHSTSPHASIRII